MKYLAEYKTFSSVSQLNEAICKQVYVNNFVLTKSARAAFDVIAKHSVKYGAAHLKAETIAGRIGKSVKTARRSVALLVSLGMIEKVETTRKISGGDGANIFRVLPVKTTNDHAKMTMRAKTTNPTATTVEAPKIEREAINPLSYKKELLHNTWADAGVPLYRRMINFVETTLGEGQQSLISSLYGVYRTKNSPDRLVAFEAFKTAVTAHKTRKNTMRKINNIEGYYSRTLDKMLTVVEQPKAPIREEILPAWFKREEEHNTKQLDDTFEADKRKFEEELKNRKKKTG